MESTTSNVARLLSLSRDEEVDLMTAQYIKNTAIPLLEEFVISPFQEGMISWAFSEAAKKVGIDKNGFFKGSCELEKLVDGWIAVKVKVYSELVPDYYKVLLKTAAFLNNAIADNASGRIKSGVRKVSNVMASDDKASNDIFISAKYLLDEMLRLSSSQFISSNKMEITGIACNGAEITPEQDLAEIEVFLDSSKFQNPDSYCVQKFINAWELKRELEGVVKEFESWAMSHYGIPQRNLEETRVFACRLSNNTVARYLFYPESSPKYDDVFSAFAVKAGKRGRKDKFLDWNSGDLNIIIDRAFKREYKCEYKDFRSMHGAGNAEDDKKEDDKRGNKEDKYCLVVSTQKDHEKLLRFGEQITSRRGKVTITRFSAEGAQEGAGKGAEEGVDEELDRGVGRGIGKGVKDIHVYSVYLNKNRKVYVKISEVLDYLDNLRRTMVDSRTRLRLDFYPAMPL